MANSGIPVTVVGAGVVGLTSAIRLREAGFDVTVVAEKRNEQIVSSIAGAIFSPFRIPGDERTLRWTRESYFVFERMTEARDPDDDHGVRLTRLVELLHTRAYLSGGASPWWSSVVREYRDLPRIPPPYTGGFEARVPKMDMRRLLPWLERRFQRLGGRFEQRRIHALPDTLAGGARFVVNCSGLGARELAGDPAVRPMRGQILHVENTAGLTDCMVEEARGSATTYIFPFEGYVVLGGTYERDVGDEHTEEPALLAIIERCRTLLERMQVPHAERIADKRLRVLAGLRPSRRIAESDEAVRLEAEALGDGGWVIHNYGHGRAGVTLAWGCADDVVRLVRERA